MSSNLIFLLKFSAITLRRNIGRTLFICLCVSLSVILSIWAYAFLKAFGHEIEKKAIETNTGFFQIQEKNFSKSTDSSHPLLFSEEIRKILKKHTLSFSPELILDGNINTPEGASTFKLIGIVPDLHSLYIPINKNILSGNFLNNKDENAAIIGREFARIYKLHTNDQFVINYQDDAGDLRSEFLTIAGIYDYNSRGFQKNSIYINQNTWQKLYFKTISTDTYFHRIPILTNDLSTKSKLEHFFSNSTTLLKTWKDLFPELSVIVDFQNAMIYSFFFVIGVAVMMTILNPVHILWQERLKELKLFKTLGMPMSKIWIIGLFELCILTLISSLGSLSVLSIVLGFQGRTGIDFSSINQGRYIERSGIVMPRIVYPQFEFFHFLIIIFFVFIVFAFSYSSAIYLTVKKLKKET